MPPLVSRFIGAMDGSRRPISPGGGRFWIFVGSARDCLTNAFPLLPGEDVAIEVKTDDDDDDEVGAAHGGERQNWV